MRDGSHLLRVGVQGRRRDALVCPQPQNRRERQADGHGDQRKPDVFPSSHTCDTANNFISQSINSAPTFSPESPSNPSTSAFM